MGIGFWILIAIGAFLIDKGQGDSNITVTQFFGAIFIFAAGYVMSLYALLQDKEKRNESDAIRQHAEASLRELQDRTTQE